MESSFWQRGVFSLSLQPHLKSHLYLLAEVEVKGFTNACKTWVTECCDWKTSVLNHSLAWVYLFEIVFPNENLASSIRRLEGIDRRRIVYQWEWWAVEPADSNAALSPTIIATEDATQ